MKLVPLEQANLTVPDVADMAKDGPVILTRNGKPCAVVKDLSGSDWESVSLASNRRFIDLIEASRRSYREKGGIAIDDLRKELELTKKPSRRASGKKKKS